MTPLSALIEKQDIRRDNVRARPLVSVLQRPKALGQRIVIRVMTYQEFPMRSFNTAIERIRASAVLFVAQINYPPVIVFVNYLMNIRLGAVIANNKLEIAHTLAKHRA